MSPAHHHRVLDIALGIALGGVIVLAVDAWFLREGIHTVDRAVAALQHSQHADAAPAAAAAHDELAAIVAHDAVAERWFQANIERIDHQLQIVAETCGRARPPAPLFKLPPRPGARPRLSPWGLATVAAP